ncbi:MAG: glycosyltransferase [Proteobacteria bacterium]|nr:glycosyltransferase [Pseudomonadota bacterium]
MDSTTYGLWLVHMTALCGLALYGVHRIWLLILWRRLPPQPSPPAMVCDASVPWVTIQLPLYNERFVAKRLIDATAALTWPRDRLEIQVLDDSTDHTRSIVDERVTHFRDQGVDIRVFRRTNRMGFKAGALAQGLQQAKGSLIAVFDADFVPGTDFLLRTVPCFSHKDIGMVQCRWGFLNEDHSWLTRIQAIMLASHFRIEHRVRHHFGMCFNFNGTAGIWRKEALIDAGGWQADTVTEDLDISYRAQLKGWRFVYVDDYTVPSELPTTLDAFRNQQKRWTKGSIQTARKLLPRIVFSNTLTPTAKLEATAHLLANLGWLLCLIMTLTLYPAVTMSRTLIPPLLLQVGIGLFFFSSGAVLFYFLVFALTYHKSSVRILPLIPLLSIGMAPVLSLSVISGLFTRGGTFVRTPKYGVPSRTRLSGLFRVYQRPSLGAMAINLPIFIYTLFPVWFLWQTRQWTVVFPLLFPVGFVWIMVKDLLDSLNVNSGHP